MAPQKGFEAKRCIYANQDLTPEKKKTKIMKKIFIPLVLFFVFKSSFSQISLSDSIAVDNQVKIGKLSNGLTYYIRQNAYPANKAELRLVLNVGSILETDAQQGLAHFMEHMAFNGSRNFPGNTMVDFLQRNGVKYGADLNAYTSFDETVFMLPVASDRQSLLDSAFLVLQDWAFNNAFDVKEIDKERGVVLEEARLHKGAQQRMSNKYFPFLFNGSKYQYRLPIGEEKVIQTFTPATLKNFYTNWYRPNLMSVVVVGDVDVDEVEEMIVNRFAKYNNPRKAPTRPAITAVKARNEASAMVVTDPEATSTLVQIFNNIQPQAKIQTWADYRKSIIENLAFSIINNRLSELGKKENSPYLFAFAGNSPFLRGYESITSTVMVKGDQVQGSVDALIREINRARKYGFLPAELSRAKSELKNSAEKSYMERENMQSAGYAAQYVSHFLNQTPLPGIENRHEFIRQVADEITLQEVNEVATQIPGHEKATTLLLAPSAQLNNLPDHAGLVAMVASADKIAVDPYEESAIAEKLIEELPAPGTITASSHNEKLGTFNYTLGNGVTVTLKPTTFKNDEIQMDGWRHGGYQQYNVNDRYNAQLAANIVENMGFGPFNPVELEKFLAGKSLHVTPYLNPSEEGIEGYSSVKDLETFFQLVYAAMMSPRTDESLFRAYIEQQKAGLQYVSNNPDVTFQDTLQRILYQNHPWTNTIPLISDYESISLPKAMEYYRKTFNNADGLHFTFVGNIDTTVMLPLIKQYIASLPASKTPHEFHDNQVRMLDGARDILLKRGQEDQAEVLFIWEGLGPATPENQMKLAALLEVLNIEVNEKLREEMGSMYAGGFGGGMSKRPVERFNIQASIPTSPQEVDAVTKALLALIRDAQAGKITRDNLNKVKANWTRQRAQAMENNGFWLQQLSNAFINGTDPEQILTYNDRVNTLTVNDLTQIARSFLDLNQLKRVVRLPVSAQQPEKVEKVNGFRL